MENSPTKNGPPRDIKTLLERITEKLSANNVGEINLESAIQPVLASPVWDENKLLKNGGVLQSIEIFLALWELKEVSQDTALWEMVQLLRRIILEKFDATNADGLLVVYRNAILLRQKLYNSGRMQDLARLDSLHRDFWCMLTRKHFP